jgi:murein DD-endopeptidase MepM/ murein hydrolase activator NlpD
MDRTHGRIGIRLLIGVIAGPAAVCALTLTGTTGNASAAEVSDGALVSGAVWPVDPHPVVRSFDPPGCLWCAGHRGVDLGSLPLASVKAATAGTVTYAGPLAGRDVLVIDDGTRRVTYEPVTSTLVRGTVVRPGEMIGTVGLAGSHCYPDACLHLGLIDDATDAYLDPLTLFGEPGPVRLLPLWIDEPDADVWGRFLALF